MVAGPDVLRLRSNKSNLLIRNDERVQQCESQKECNLWPLSFSLGLLKSAYMECSF
jgi:DNA polymerase III psi subunit